MVSWNGRKVDPKIIFFGSNTGMSDVEHNYRDAMKIKRMHFLHIAGLAYGQAGCRGIL